jgi:hypothetical protein
MAENLPEIGAVLDLEGWGRESVRLRLEGMLDLVRGFLVAKARSELGSTASKYVEAIGEPVFFEPRPGVLAGTITLGQGADGGDAGLALLLENGCGPWDMRQTLLPGRSPDGLHITEDGYFYRSIPFRHGAAGGEARNFPPMGSQFTRDGQQRMSMAHRGALDAAHAGAIGQRVHNAARELDPTLSAPGRRMQPWKSGCLEAGLAPLLRQRHVTDIFAGMVRETKTYERSTQDSFMTFRTISQHPRTFRYDTQTRRGADHPGGAFNVMGNTQERNWVHPGFVARGFFRQAEDYVQTLLDSGESFGELPAGGTP